MHVADLLPTVGRIAGIQFNSSAELDGIDQWDVMSLDVHAVREEIVEFDDVFGYGFYMLYPYKLVQTGRVGYSDCLSNLYESNDIDPSFYPTLVLNSTASKVIQSIQKKESHLTAREINALREKATISCSNNPLKRTCNTKSLCLFNIFEDQCEENDLSETSEALMQTLLAKFNNQKKKAVGSRRKHSDPACDPINFNNHWHWWQPDTDN